MTWLQLLAQAGVIATFLGAGIAVAAYFNGKHVKEGVGKLGEMISKQGEMISKQGEMINKLGEMINKVGEMISKLGETNNGIKDLLAEMKKDAAQQHQEVVALLDKGFGTLIQHRAT